MYRSDAVSYTHLDVYKRQIYEGADRAGGLLEYGIPNMKLEKGVIARKVEADVYKRQT